MKITVGQLKQLIKEQVEEQWKQHEIYDESEDGLTIAEVSSAIDEEVRLLDPEVELVKTGHWSSIDRHGFTHDAIVDLVGGNKFTVTLYGNGQGGHGRPAPSTAELKKDITRSIKIRSNLRQKRLPMLPSLFRKTNIMTAEYIEDITKMIGTLGKVCRSAVVTLVNESNIF